MGSAERLVCLAAVLSMVGGGCSSDRLEAAPGPDDLPARQLSFIRFAQAGAACLGDCSTSHAVEADAMLVLGDAAGELSFSIEPAEFEHIEQLALTAEFAQIVEDSLAGRDCGGFDIHLSMTYQWVGEAVEDVPHVDSCGVTEGYVVRDIYQYLKMLKERHLECPPWQEPPGFQLATDPLPQRALCWFCYGKCQTE